MKVLITGIAGFTGKYLAEHLQHHGHEVVGIAQDTVHLPGVQQVFKVDLLDEIGLQTVLATVKPDMVVHLAAISFVGHSDVNAIYQTNLIGTRNLLEALCAKTIHCQSILLASSSNVYGNSSNTGILTEESTLEPRNDYAVSKLAMEYMARLYLDRLPIIIARPFNYIGVGQSIDFLIPKIVDHFSRLAPIIELGNLDVARDFSDVRVTVEAYRRLLECPSAIGGIFNICSGTAYSLSEVLTLCHKITGHNIEVVVNPAFVRKNEVKKLIGSRKRLEDCIGKLSDISLEDTLRWLFESTD